MAAAASWTPTPWPWASNNTARKKFLSPPAAGLTSRISRAANTLSPLTRVFDLEHFPQRLVVVGGGYIAVEFAGIFNGLGAEVTQLYRGPLFLRGFDEDIRTHAAQEIAKTGVDLRFDINVESISRTADGLR